MTKSLRKKHLQVWIALAMLLPIGVLSAWLVVPGLVAVQALPREKIELLPTVVQSVEGNCYTVNFRSNEQRSAFQLEWKNTAPLKVPSALIYRVINGDSDITKNELIGRIEAKGDYVFALRQELPAGAEMNFVLYDFIHQQIIDRLKLKL